MPMRIHDSVKRRKVRLEPLNPGEVRMYVCGPTVYDDVHIGNARTFLSFDVIRKYLAHEGYRVTMVQNITDVDDKIIDRAAEEGRAPAEVADEYTAAFIDVMRAFGVDDPDIRCYATREIDAMIAMIEALISKDHAYVSGGDVYFSVRSYEPYGSLSGRHVDDLMSGARVEANDRKRDPLDFALWKAAKPGEPYWDSPWGEGRPGWHTECAAMVEKYLGVPIDIHGGGSDLSFPHHENESAQAGAAFGAELARTWMHTGMLTVDGEKMSKSLGNFHTLKDVLANHDPMALRLLMLQTHYRSPLDFSFERLEGAGSSLDRFATLVRNLSWAGEKNVRPDAAAHPTSADDDLSGSIDVARSRFTAEMRDDFNTAGALAAVFSLVTQANAYLDSTTESGVDPELTTSVVRTIVELLGVLGIRLPEAGASELPMELIDLAAELLGGQAFDTPEEAAEGLMEARAGARVAKNWATADAIRDGLTALGFTIEDTAAGARVVRA